MNYMQIAVASKKDYPEAKLYLINQGFHAETVGDIKILPIIEALKQLPSILS